jgi:hypothetical protein
MYSQRECYFHVLWLVLVAVPVPCNCLKFDSC